MYVVDTLWLLFPAREGAIVMAMNDDARAISDLRRLDPQVVGAVYDRYFTDVYRYVRYRIDDDTAAEDIASDIFVRLLEAFQKGRGPESNLKGWLIATASNAVNDYLRRRYRRPTEEISETLPDENANVHLQVDAREQARLVQEAYVQLTAEQQDVLALRFGLGLSLEETARQLRKNVNSVKALQFRALASLQRVMGEMNYE